METIIGRVIESLKIICCSACMQFEVEVHFLQWVRHGTIREPEYEINSCQIVRGKESQHDWIRDEGREGLGIWKGREGVPNGVPHFQMRSESKLQSARYRVSIRLAGRVLTHSLEEKRQFRVRSSIILSIPTKISCYHQHCDMRRSKLTTTFPDPVRISKYLD